MSANWLNSFRGLICLQIITPQCWHFYWCTVCFSYLLCPEIIPWHNENLSNLSMKGLFHLSSYYWDFVVIVGFFSLQKSNLLWTFDKTLLQWASRDDPSKNQSSLPKCRNTTICDCEFPPLMPNWQVDLLGNPGDLLENRHFKGWLLKQKGWCYKLWLACSFWLAALRAFRAREARQNLNGGVSARGECVPQARELRHKSKILCKAKVHFTCVNGEER